ncbi:polycomb protein Sfmbt-like isoform X1 [Apis laboriosa]|uniref:polycomb protein Sfmbt-like isoform X1 n=2 Tax=Apis laboriosa TaxID=183418 RepID=UPI001CC37014|nr:polycomb protein Sfmbt-like isoform X1 [Apis laboriosa]
MFPSGKGMDICMNSVYASIPGLPELGMVWMGDMMVHGEPTHELMLDPRQAESPFFSHGSNPYEDIRNHQIAPTTMVRYLPPQFPNECSEPDEAMEAVDAQEIQQEYDSQSERQEMTEYLTLEDYMGDEEREQVVNNAATQTTQDNRNRKIKPIKHPGLVLKTPIAYQPHTDLNFIPIRKDGIAVCEKCGAIGVKHAFYTKERRFCSRACARSSEHTAPTADSTYSPSHSIETPTSLNSSSPNESKVMKNAVVKEETDIKESSELEKEKVISELVMPEDLPVRRKRTAEMAGSYDWTPQLIEPGFCAAPVSCFKHAPISEIWDNITVGMKVEVENTDCDEVCEAFPDSFWVATVLRISGYRALLRYEGFGLNADKDFWVSLCSNDIHPVGWCATIGKPLIPPNTIANKYKDWKDFLMRRLTGARTLPTNFYNKVNDSMKSRFRCGLHLEVVDKNRISQVKVATIQKIVGKRLHVRYYDSPPEDNGFWCHEDSPLIHPVGWAKRIGQTLDAYPEYLERVSKSKLCEDDATEDLFYVPKNHHVHLGYTFREGMKVEAIDPLNLSAICAATVMQVLKEDYIMIRIDSYDEDASGADWFCYHSCSPCIFPIGFCSQHGLPLTPPKGYDPTTFTWDAYLTETNTIPAPVQLFNREIPQHGFIEGMRLEAADLMDPRLVCVATITRVIGRLLRVHFDGWEDEYDQWLDCQSPDIYPVGWCDLVDHKLEGPRVLNKNTSPTVKSPRGLKRKAKRKLKKSNKVSCAKNILPRHSERISMAREREREVEPAQGIKIERECDLESLPEQRNREPEPAEEPAGPDQTLPSPTTGQGQALNDTQSEIQSPPPPKERTATSYINVTSASSKYIPRLADGVQKSSESGDLVPSEWNVFDVAQFLRVNDCATYCDNFSKRKIDGKTLLTLTKDQIIDLTGFKVGPSLKIYDLIQQLKIKVNPAQERLKLGLKKLL